jgi:hypothetical protein
MPRSYYEMVTDIIADLDRVYDRVGGLRDSASQEEKEIYNNTRGVLGSVANSWREFADSIPIERGQMLLPGWHDEK